MATSPIDYDQTFLLRVAILGGTFLVLLALALILPGAWVAIQHAAVPFSKARYTRVEVAPGNVEIPLGKSVAVTNTFFGRPPKDPSLHWQEGDSAKWQRVALREPLGATYIYALTNLKADVTYRVTGSDAVSDNYRITTYVPPEVKDLTIDIGYPAYTRLSPATQKSPNITAVRASTVRLRIQPTVDLGQASLRFSALPKLPLTRDADGWWTASLILTNDNDYWIELADQKGHPGGNETPFHIKALPDRPPKVEITEPGKDIRASATNKVLVKISAADDFGVEGVKLVFNKLGGPQHEIVVAKSSERQGVVSASAELDLSTLGLKEYELVAYHAEAIDNNTLDGPGVGRSPVYFVEITNEEGAGGKSLSQGQGQKVNLLVIQKQIIADTTALSAKAPADKFQDLAARENDAADFGRMYLDAMTEGGAPEAATSEMQAALKDMESAKAELGKLSRSSALPSEEGALAHLYQVLKLMPELENLPVVPKTADQKPPPSPKVKVVLEAIKQKQKDQADNKELEAALEKAQELARSQSGLNTAMRHPTDASAESQSPAASQSPDASGQNPSDSAEAGKGQSPKPGQGQEESKPADQNQAASGKDSSAESEQESPNAGKGQGQGKPQTAGKGQGQSDQEGQTPGDPGSGSTSPQSPAQMAEKEAELSKEAAALAEKLTRLAGKDTRLGHNAGKNANRAAAKMDAASRALAAGNSGMAGENGFQGELALRSLIAQLERLLKNQPEPSDIAAEDFPKDYEALISEYLKKLSHAD